MDIKDIKLKQIINEFCFEWDLELYRSCLEIAIQIIKDNDFSVSIWRNGPRSKINWDQNHIQIAISEKSKGTLAIIWDILHEIGHLLTGNPKNNDFSTPDKITREEIAWENAWIIVKSKMPALVIAYEDFNNYRNDCLMSYKNQPK